MKRIEKICTALAFLAFFPAVGCKKSNNNDVLEDVVSRNNYVSVYDKIGKDVTIDEVREGADGRAYVVNRPDYTDV